MLDEMWYMQILEGMSAKQDNHTSTRLADIGLSLPLKVISDNGLALYFQSLYWEERGKVELCSLNIVVEDFSTPPTLDIM